MKISLLSLDINDFGNGEKLYVNMPADLDQFRRENSHGTIIRGKGLIQLGHGAPDGGCLFN